MWRDSLNCPLLGSPDYYSFQGLLHLIFLPPSFQNLTSSSPFPLHSLLWNSSHLFASLNIFFTSFHIRKYPSFLLSSTKYPVSQWLAAPFLLLISYISTFLQRVAYSSALRMDVCPYELVLESSWTDHKCPLLNTTFWNCAGSKLFIFTNESSFNYNRY
jgi:hypothetical protein